MGGVGLGGLGGARGMYLHFIEIGSRAKVTGSSGQARGLAGIQQAAGPP